jgi:hypothetical protein
MKMFEGREEVGGTRMEDPVDEIFGRMQREFFEKHPEEESVFKENVETKLNEMMQAQEELLESIPEKSSITLEMSTAAQQLMNRYYKELKLDQEKSGKEKSLRVCAHFQNGEYQGVCACCSNIEEYQKCDD